MRTIEENTSTRYLEDLNWRYATKKFDPDRTLSEEELDLLLQAVRLSASSYGLQPYKVLILKDRELREQLQPACWNQSQITEASHLIVLANRTDVDEELIDSYLREVSATRSVPFKELEGYGSFMKSKLLDLPSDTKQSWTARQAYIAAGNLLSAAAAMRIDTCPMEGFDEKLVDEILELTEKGLSAALVIPVGYRSAADQTQHYKKVRRAEAELFEYL